MPTDKLTLLQAKAEEKAAFIDSQLAKLEKLLDKLGPLLNQQIVDDFLSQLSIENGQVLTDIQNLRTTALIEAAYETFLQQEGFKVVAQMIPDLYELTGLNLDYFTDLEGMKVNGTDIEKIVNERLGLNDKGELKKKGFMKGLLDDPTVKNDIKQFALDKVMGGTGYEDLRSGLKEKIEGSPDKMGSFKQHYRNTAYDTYAKIDRLNGKLWADKLDLKYFIYAGTKRKASRHFCISKKGKVFSTDEADKWKDEIGITIINNKGKRVPAGPIVTGEDVATYNPLIDCGGYGCVDDIMYISEEIAFARRPDLNKK